MADGRGGPDLTRPRARLLKQALALVVLVAALVGGWYYASPLLAARGLQQAALAGDADQLRERVDFPAVQESLKPQLAPLLERQSELLAGMGILRRLAPGVAEDLAEQLVERAVTPEALAAMIAQGRSNPLAGTALAAGAAAAGASLAPPKWDIERRGFNRFSLVSRDSRGRQLPELQFARRGMAWKLVAVDLQPGPGGRRESGRS